MIEKKKDRRRRHRTPLYKSFGFAIRGVWTCLKTERNIRIHCLAAVLVGIFGAWLKISVTEWLACLGLFGMIMGLELMNTAVEAVVDLVTEEYRPLAEKAKDVAAGAVLIAAFFAAIMGCIIFLPKLALYFGLL